MTITFFTNFINHHQVPLADEFYNLIGDNYQMVTFEPLPEEFKKRGYKDYSYKKYLLTAYDSIEKLHKAEKLALESDIIILGAAPEYLLTNRLKENKITFRYEERIFKKIDSRFLNIKYWIKLYCQHTRYRYKKLYMLGASAYNKLDTTLLLSYPNKCFKWGYFINPPQIDINNILYSKRSNSYKILWCGTISQVKRPDLAIKLAQMLKQRNIDFHLNLIGSGGKEWTSLVTHLINEFKLEKNVTLLGNLPNEKVLQLMQEHHIFIFTSDRGEGWGVVLNEAMANGCTVVASNKIGAAPFLIENKKNGMLFKSGDVNSLYQATKTIIDNEYLREKLAIEAYNTIKNKWSPKVAAKNFIKLAETLNENKTESPILEGPCSKAHIINSKKILK